MPTTYKASLETLAAISATVALMNGAPVQAFAKAPAPKNDTALQPK